MGGVRAGGWCVEGVRVGGWCVGGVRVEGWCGEGRCESSEIAVETSNSLSTDFAFRYDSNGCTESAVGS